MQVELLRSELQRLLRQTPFRLVRKGTEEPWRGTLCQIENETYLFTSGYVPW